MKQLKYLAFAGLVAFAACEGTTEPPVVVPVTGTITGTVSIEGAGRAGVVVTLSNNATATTSATGSYSFTAVAAGAYTITISGLPTDAAFASGTSKAAVIATAGQSVTVDFAGTFVRTSAILGGVSGPSGPLANVVVTLSGTSAASATTNAGGQYSFSGLRAGTYTVTISGFPSSVAFAAPSQANIVLAVGESKSASFVGTAVTTARVTGSMFLDENEKNDNFDSTEEKLKVANVTVTLEGGGLPNPVTVQTDANGDYTFTNLAAGSYVVTIAATDTDLPTMVTFGLASSSVIRTVAVGTAASAHFPFDITKQTIKVYGFLGTDANAPGKAPIPGWQLSLYDTDANANTATATGRLGQVTTTAGGEAAFRFDRAKDLGPSGNVDNIVYARATGALPTNYVRNGELIIEIKYSAKDSLSLSPDTFDALNGLLVVSVRALEIDSDTLATWSTELRSRADSNVAYVQGLNTDAKGLAYFTFTPGGPTTGDGQLPDTLWVRLSDAQPGANGHGFTQTPTAARGTVSGRFLKFIWDGTILATDTVNLGSQMVKYKDANVTVRVHNERDDSTGVTATYTLGDGLAGVDLTTVELFSVASGVRTSVAAAVVPPIANGIVSWGNMDVTKVFEVVAKSTNAGYTMLKKDTVSATLDGSDQSQFIEPLKGSAGGSTFAIKSNNNVINGMILARDTSAVHNRRVRILAGPGNIQGTKDTTVVTSATGAYTTLGNLLEGPYTVTVADSVAGGVQVWTFLDTLKVGSTLPITSGTADNLNGTTAMRDLQGFLWIGVANFTPYRMNTTIQGVIANDRDGDASVIDVGSVEGLPSAEVKLYKDNTGTAVVSNDSLVATVTTDARGAFVFSGLKEGRYIVRPTAGTTNTILRGLTVTDAPIDTAIVVTAADTTGAGATLNGDRTLSGAGRTVGVTDGFTGALPLPKWNYGASNLNLVAGLLANRQPHFTFLLLNGKVTGTVQTAAAVVQVGRAITAVKCRVVTGAGPGFSPGVRGVDWFSPAAPIGGSVCTATGTTKNATTGSDGKFSIPDLAEGIWKVEVTGTGVVYLYEILGNLDEETAVMVVPSVSSVPLGAAAPNGIMAGTAVTCITGGTINANVSISPGNTLTGFGPCVITGVQHLADAVAAQGQVDLTAAYNTLAGLPCPPANAIVADLGGTTKPAGVYCTASGISVTGTLTLDGGGDPNATFVFQAGTSLTTAGSVVLINGAQAKNVWWKVGSSATLGTASAWQGNIVALTSITMVDNATLLGRALARNGAVTLGTNNVITLP